MPSERRPQSLVEAIGLGPDKASFGKFFGTRRKKCVLGVLIRGVAEEVGYDPAPEGGDSLIPDHRVA